MLAPGQRFGTRYRIIRELGRGGMGVVYQAWDDELGIAVALKIVRPEESIDPDTARERELRFKRELVLARQVTHKHVVRIHDLGEVDGIKYLSMPFIQGATLAVRLARDGRLPVAQALRFARQIASGLSAAHDEGVIHRDLKPANVMVDADEEIVVLDFGLARSVSGLTVGTATGTVMGTVEYMAPEQATGSRVDQRADIYAFGLIFHEMLVGRRRTSDSVLSDLIARSREAPPRVRSLDPQIPAAIDDVIARCLNPDPAHRYRTSADLVADLDRLDAEGRPLLGRTAAPRRTPRLVAMLAVLACASIAAAVTLVVRDRHGAPAASVVAARPVSVLIPDFDNRTGDKVFQGALEEALRLAVEGASFITAYPRTDAARALERIRPGENLSESNARLIAQREGIDLVLPGVIGRRDASYTLALKIVEPQGHDTPRVVETTARDKSDVLTALVSLSGRVRTVLGDSANAGAVQAAAETFTTASLAAMREYALAQDLLLRRRDLEAIDHYRAAVEHDPKFGRAYAGWAVAAHTIGKEDEAVEQWKRAMTHIDRMTEREKYRTLGGYYLDVARDYDKAVETYQALVSRYPADTAGHSNLALTFFYKLNFGGAFDEGQRAIALQKKSLRFRSNYALYAMYAGRFDEAERQCRTLIADAPASYIAYLPLAVSQAVGGNRDAARQTYARMKATDETGESTAAQGLADLALYEGDLPRARAILEQAIPGDRRAGNTLGLAAKLSALGEAASLAGDRKNALATAEALVALGHREEMLVPAATIYIGAGRLADAHRLATELQDLVPPQARAYGRMIDGAIALKQGRGADAITALRAAQQTADLWLVRYHLAVAYLHQRMYAEALSDLELCEKRRGEATAVFLDDLPTVRYLARLSPLLDAARKGLSAADPGS